jgi:glycerophosphoryl diester phosphodiesterase
VFSWLVLFVPLASCAPEQSASRCAYVKTGSAQLSNSFWVIAHRGNAEGKPENTLVSIAAALSSGATAVEVDVHFSRDRVPVVIHDDTLERTTSGTGRVADRTAAELHALDAGSWAGAAYRDERVPMLREVFESVAGRGRVLLDIKVDGLAESVREILRELHLPQQAVAVAVQTESQARDFVTHTPGAHIWWNFEAPATWDGGFFERLKSMGVDAIELGANWSREFVVDAHRHGLPVHAYVINDSEILRDLLALGIDGIETDLVVPIVQTLRQDGWRLDCARTAD